MVDHVVVEDVLVEDVLVEDVLENDVLAVVEPANGKHDPLSDAAACAGEQELLRNADAADAACECQLATNSGKLAGGCRACVGPCPHHMIIVLMKRNLIRLIRNQVGHLHRGINFAGARSKSCHSRSRTLVWKEAQGLYPPSTEEKLATCSVTVLLDQIS